MTRIDADRERLTAILLIAAGSTLDYHECLAEVREATRGYQISADQDDDAYLERVISAVSS